MLLVKRNFSGRLRPSVYYIVDGDFRSAPFYSIMELLAEAPEMFYNPNFLDETNSRVTFTTIAEVSSFEDFPILYPELFI